MCLVLLAWQVHPDFPLVLAANRDEFHVRPAAAAAWWDDAPGLLAGRDLDAGGTWLGVTRDARFAVLTNYRGPQRHAAAVPSRGALVRRALVRPEPLAATLGWLERAAGAYNGFNLLFSDGARLGVFESVPGAGRELPPGVYGLSNHLLDTPWPKVTAAKSQLSATLARLPEEAPLLELLRDDRPAADHELPRTGLSLEWERLLSSAFIRAPGYGTRCSTIVLMDREGTVRFVEWSWDAGGASLGIVRHAFSRQLPVPAGRAPA
ncbi:MAG: NRDE family protein [Gammaproteobacteria bacterium]|nr:NRDE family protein [Gammaproteobacteria bacterium]